jgi:protein-disulfide isomerase
MGSDAGMPISVFSDLECPACRGLHFRLRELDKLLPGNLSIRYIHYPLSYHRFAMSAAKLAECAASTGQFADIVDQVFTHQTELAMISWEELAERAGVPSPGNTAACASAPDDAPTFRRIAAGRALADSLKLIGTPMVVVDGTIYDNPPTDAEFRNMLTAFRRK